MEGNIALETLLDQHTCEIRVQRDIREARAAKRELLSLAYRVARRARKNGLAGRTITLKVKYRDFTQITRSETIPEPTDDGREIYSVACSLLRKTEVGERPVRLLGIGLSQIEQAAGKQLPLFRNREDHSRRKDLNKALDSLHEKFGERGIFPGTLLDKE
ncbi:MAG: hypothetical protein JRJ03_14085 [Deltaproteobacteria bacterium]|nr:hypothetical protein [Deltaproteobacteria bacterium]